MRRKKDGESDRRGMGRREVTNGEERRTMGGLRKEFREEEMRR